MSIRYSGDVEVRVTWDPREKSYTGYVRDPKVRWNGFWRPRQTPEDPTSPEAYDAAAKALIRLAKRDVRGRLSLDEKRGRIRLRRVFQAPCPT
jgi:hypothetical protein